MRSVSSVFKRTDGISERNPKSIYAANDKISRYIFIQNLRSFLILLSYWYNQQTAILQSRKPKLEQTTLQNT